MSKSFYKISGLLFLTLYYCACQNKTTNRITIATASNMQYAAKSLSDAFSKKTNISCDLVIGSSGKLSTQILNGAPYDVFLAADMEYPKKIYDANLSIDFPKNYALGSLVLWSIDSASSIARLTNKEVEHIAIANSENAPYGLAAIEALKHYNIYESIKSKLVYGESISQTNQFITTGAAQIGFSSLSTVLSSEMKDKGFWQKINPKHHPPLDQGIVVIKNNNSLKSQQFMDFLFTPEAQNILISNGFSVK